MIIKLGERQSAEIEKYCTEYDLDPNHVINMMVQEMTIAKSPKVAAKWFHWLKTGEWKQKA
ncbi:hypothetical protein [Herbiconiux daphne]|uniref:Uncharacterized protein n=1 Tax=Herbiconiux daphne TaxID=2970914 RepID=A0ABT2HBX0_9MICO|nr:hypothetical protein [Herbiconiux daphne]MCS5737433.1 hypothetical protein [Herbiconiux daphne]